MLASVLITAVPTPNPRRASSAADEIESSMDWAPSESSEPVSFPEESSSQKSEAALSLGRRWSTAF